MEILSKENKINEFLFTSLRTMWGCDLEKLSRIYSYDLLQVNRDYIQHIVDQNLANLDKSILRLTSRGMLLADKIASDFFIETINE